MGSFIQASGTSWTLGLSPAAERENLGWTQGEGGQGTHDAAVSCFTANTTLGAAIPSQGHSRERSKGMKPGSLPRRSPFLMNHECFGLDVVINPSAGSDRVHNGGV